MTPPPKPSGKGKQQLPAVSGKELVRVLERLGWTLIRTTGSHLMMADPARTMVVPVPVHKNESLKTGTLRGILRQTGVSDEDLTRNL